MKTILIGNFVYEIDLETFLLIKPEKDEKKRAELKEKDMSAPPVCFIDLLN